MAGSSSSSLPISVDFVSHSNARSYSLFSSSSQNTTIKLDCTNFLVWESIALPLIEGNQLEGHINGSLTSLAKLLFGTPGGTRSNPAYFEWLSVD
ncbi:hypothetical protein QN277_000580 [Acacia crassicarpa]|uniref:Uncharacterized protein n=1 Tax=Acacia crassicarpa TaxID=499986 RepID=A0AAE1TFR2_9FABA|nr:hypothetical protein QN277_000580 [Acacia crassicarpa]